MTQVKVTHVRLFATPSTVQSTEFFRPGDCSGQPFPSPGDLANPGIEPRPPALQTDSLPAEPQGKPKNTRMGSLSLLQRNFQTEESNQGLLHCRWIPYQLSSQGSPWYIFELFYFSFYWSSLGLGPLFPVLCSLCRNVRLFLPVLVLSTNLCLCCSTSPLASFCLLQDL